MARLVLIAGILAGVRAQGSYHQAGGALADTGQGSQARGFPWIAHSSMEGFYLASPASGGAGQPYQVSAYQGFTIQSLRFAWFHAGWRYRETLPSGASEAYREPFCLKLAGTAEVLRNHVFLSLGGNVPLFTSPSRPEDTLAYFNALNGYSPFPAPNFLSPQALQASVTGRIGLGQWDMMAGLSYTRPTEFEPIDGFPFHPASYLDVILRALLDTRLALHRWDIKATRYGEEQTESQVPAHREGGVYQLRYSCLRSSGRIAWQLGMGGAYHEADADRTLKLRSTELAVSEDNRNLQRGYAEMALSWRPKPTLLLRLHLLPKALFDLSARETGAEIETGLTFAIRLMEVHRLRATGNLLTGKVRDRGYLGGGLRVEFSFRRLGFQDLENESAAVEGR